MAAASLTFGARGFMKPGSIRSRARNMALYSVKAGALGFPIGMIQMKLMESGIMVSPSISKSPSAENPHSVVKEDVEKN
ncbi:uncharacterized protein [Medicago truncatula]|nr:uncharacterized protein LOC25493755 isoform X2 [Medicago truncatula]